MVSNYQSLNQQMQTIRQKHNNVLQVSGLIGGPKHQGVYSCMKQSFNLFIISSV
jgi:hypothetical protein